MKHVESPEWIPASSRCSITAPIKTSLPSDAASTSNSIAWPRYSSTSRGLSGARYASARYASNCFSLASISIPRPPRTYDGRIRTGNPILSTAFLTSSALVPVAPLGILIPFLSANASNLSRSLASSIASQVVPRISKSIFKTGNRFSSGRARLIAV